VNLLAAANPPPLVRMSTGLGLTAAQRQRRAESTSPVAKTEERGKIVVSKVKRFLSDATEPEGIRQGPAGAGPAPVPKVRRAMTCDFTIQPKV